MRKIVRLRVMVMALVMFLSLTTTAFSQCGTVANDLSLVLPCVEFEGQYYKISFCNYPNPADPTWLYWRYESIQFAPGGSTCAHLDADLTITAPCVYCAGYNFAITLEYCPNVNPTDPGGLYWKLSSQLTVNPVSINSISGAGLQCIDDQDFQGFHAFLTCIMECNDAACMSNCMQDLGFGDFFSLAFELNNPESTPIEFVLPAGAYFEPGAGDVQPMLIAIDEVLTVSPGVSTVCVPTYCMQSDDDIPSEENRFTISGIAQQPCIAEILDLIRGKDISSVSSIIQDAIWDCMDSDSITEDQRTALKNL